MKYKKILICVAVILIAVIVVSVFKDKILKIIYPKTYKEVVQIYQEKYNIDENLIYALIKAESNFDNKAVSNRSAVGVMQLMEETAKDVAKKNNIEINYDNIKEELLKVDVNINVGTRYLASLLEKYGNKEVALAAYNAGIGTVDNWIDKGIIKADGSDIENIPYKETNNYVRKILRDYKIYEKIYNR